MRVRTSIDIPLWLILLSAGCWHIATAAAHADAGPSKPDPTLTSGLAVGIQVPTGAGLVGGRVDYYLQLPKTWYRLAAHAAVGGRLCFLNDCHASVSFGAMGLWGHKHRAVLELLTGTIGAIGLRLYGENIGSRPVWGASFTAGYQYMDFKGFFVRSGVGVGWVWEPAITPADKRIGFALVIIHIGQKLW